MDHRRGEQGSLARSSGIRASARRMARPGMRHEPPMIIDQKLAGSVSPA